MQLNAREDIEAPIDDVFRAVTDFKRFEHVLLRRGAEIERMDDLPVPGAGMRWAIRFDLRGKRREALLEMTDFTVPEGLEGTVSGPGIDMDFQVQLIALSRRRTRMQTRAEFRPNSFSGRMLLQSARLARGRLLKRYRRAVADFADRLESRLGSDDRA